MTLGMMATEISELDLAWWLRMDPTPFSLLDRLKVAGPDAADWNRLHAIYFPRHSVRFHPRDLRSVPTVRRRGHPGRPGAQELGLSENAVMLAKARVLKRLREEAGDLLE